MGNEIVSPEPVADFKQDCLPLLSPTNNPRKTMEKGTQTTEEIEMPKYPDVADNSDASRLKAWIENLFKDRIPESESESQ